MLARLRQRFVKLDERRTQDHVAGTVQWYQNGFAAGETTVALDCGRIAVRPSRNHSRSSERIDREAPTTLESTYQNVATSDHGSDRVDPVSRQCEGWSRSAEKLWSRRLECSRVEGRRTNTH